MAITALKEFVKKLLPRRVVEQVQRRVYLKRLHASGFDPEVPTLPLNQRVGFVIVGAQKAGTSAILDYLREHPQIGGSLQTEVHFFDNNGYFQRETTDYTD